MRNSSTRFVSLLLAVVMVFSLALTGYAAERTPLLVLHGDEKEPVLNGRVTVCVDTTVDAVLADGKLTIRYDSQKLQFLSAKGGEAWRDNTDLSLQVNSNEAGKLDGRHGDLSILPSHCRRRFLRDGGGGRQLCHRC